MQLLRLCFLAHKGSLLLISWQLLRKGAPGAPSSLLLCIFLKNGWRLPGPLSVLAPTPPPPPPRNSQHSVSVSPWGSPSCCASLTSLATFGSHCCFCVLHVANKAALPPSGPRRAPPANGLHLGPVSLNVPTACRTGIRCLLFYSGTLEKVLALLSLWRAF